MADEKYFTISESDWRKVLGLIRESHSVSEGIDDTSLPTTNSTYSSFKITELLETAGVQTEDVTYAQYQALTEEQKKDGTIRFITDVDSDGTVTGYTAGDGIEISEDKVISNSLFTLSPFKWELIGTSSPETSETSNNIFQQTMSGGLPFIVFHASGVFCFGNGINKGKLFGNTSGTTADVTYSDSGLLDVQVGQGKAYIYQMINITE